MQRIKASKNKFSNILALILKMTIGKSMFKQELLLRLALKEKGFNPQKLKIECNHILGKNYVNNIEFGIKYPDSFYNEAINLIPDEKIYDFYFNGNMSKSGERATMLYPFKNKTNSIIIASDEGRIQSKKDKFNQEYFSEFAKSKFGLCPHQADWIGDKAYMWTYRFIEACFVEAIPVLFRKAPLGNIFTKGFYYIWDDDVNDNVVYDFSKANKNKNMAKERFLFSEKECCQIKETLQ